MNKFLEKYQKDQHYRNKIKLIIYISFIILVSIYALIINMNSSNTSPENIINNNPDEENNQTNQEQIIKIPNSYTYQITVTVDDEEIIYTGEKEYNKITINKKSNDLEENYLYEDNKYYQDNSGTYILTSKEKIYDKIDYTYLNLDNINIYLNNSTKKDNQYLVYLKDIILGDTSNDYFVVTIKDNRINIDYTPLMKKFNQSLKKAYVKIELEEKEWKRWIMNEKKESKKGLIALIVCGLLALALIIACVFFPKEFFGLFTK